MKVLSASLVAAAFCIVSSASAANIGTSPTATGEISLNLAFGPSLPADQLDSTNVDTKGLTRANGGETIRITFKRPTMISSIQLAGYSASSMGAAVIRDAKAMIHTDAGDATISLGELFNFNLNGFGQFQNYKGNVMLGNNNFIQSPLGLAVSELSFQVEGFRHSDATLLMQMVTDSELEYYDFRVDRVAVIAPPSPPPHNRPYFKFAQGRDGWGHCYQYTGDGRVLNGGMPVSNYLCGNSTYQWGRGRDGYTYCYEVGGGFYLNQGQPVANYLCGG